MRPALLTGRRAVNLPIMSRFDGNLPLAYTAGGASVRTVIDRSGAEVPRHAHDWPLLSLFVLGSYRNETELGTTTFEGPSAILYRAGACHSNVIGRTGFEQIEIEFDPSWVGSQVMPDAPVTQWVNGRGASAMLQLIEAVRKRPDEQRLREEIQRFLSNSVCAPMPPRPRWADKIEQLLRTDPRRSIKSLAAQEGCHPAWLGRAYARTAGENLSTAAARFRVTRAAHLLRETDQSAAEISLDAGFCDQSHMIRTFRTILGRSPNAVRGDRRLFR